MNDWTPKQQRLFHRILEYIGKHNLYIEFYNGVVEPGYDDVPTALADWNAPSNHPDSFDIKHPEYYERRKRTSRLAPLLKKLGFELDWDDEWAYCHDCGKLVRTSPDSYGWEPYYIIFNDCELICNDCAKEHIEDVIEEFINTHHKALTSDWRVAIEKVGFHCIEDECEIYETGFHPGQNDDPEKVLQSIYDKVGKKWFTNKFDYLFIINSVGQFDIRWTILIRNKEEDVDHNISSISSVIRDLRKQYCNTFRYNVADINNGNCEIFAMEVVDILGEGEEIWYEDMFPDIKEARTTAHCFIKYRDRYYDAEAPDGVDHPFDLPIWKDMEESKLRSFVG